MLEADEAWNIFDGASFGSLKPEILAYSTYVIRETYPSRIDSRVLSTRATGFLCPRCSMALKLLGHGEMTVCTRCGIGFCLIGNALACYAKKHVSETEWAAKDKGK